MHRPHPTRFVRAATLTLAVAALAALAACGATTPAPAPSISWAPGESPIAAVSIPAQEATTANFEPGTGGWIFKPAVDIEVTALGFYDDGKDGLLGRPPSSVQL